MNIKKTKKSMNLMPYIVLTIVVIGSYIFLNSFSTKINKMDYNELTKEIENNNVKEFHIQIQLYHQYMNLLKVII